MSQYQRVGDWLVTQGVLTEEQRDQAIQVQQQGKSRFGEVVVSLGFTTEAEIANCLAQQYDLPRADLANIKPTEEALKLVSPTFALSRVMLPVKVTQTEFHCVISDPLDIQATDYLTRAIGKRLVLSVGAGSEIFEAITKAYSIPTEKAETTNSTQQVTEKIPSQKPKRKPRKVKVDEQADRKKLLGAISGAGLDSLWDTYEDR